MINDSKSETVTLSLNGVDVKFVIDSWSLVYLIDKKLWESLKTKKILLSDSEKAFSATEKKDSVVWAVEKFLVYLYGVLFEILSDNKLLTTLFVLISRPSNGFSDKCHTHILPSM